MIVPAPRRARRTRSRERPAVVMPLALAALVVALIAAGAYLLVHTGGGGSVLPSDGSSSKPVRLLGVGSYDPYSPDANKEEHYGEAGDAVDGDPDTAWTTEHYNDWNKPGVGLVLGTARPVTLSRMSLVTSGEFDVKIRASNSSTGEFVDVSGDFDHVGKHARLQHRHGRQGLPLLHGLAAAADERRPGADLRGDR